MTNTKPPTKGRGYNPHAACGRKRTTLANALRSRIQSLDSRIAFLEAALAYLSDEYAYVFSQIDQEEDE